MNGTKLASVASSNYPNALSTVLSWKLISQSIKNNTSKIRFYLTLSNVNANYSGGYGSDYSKFTINDTTVFDDSYRVYYGDTELGYIDVTVKHLDNGKFPGYTITAQAYSYHFQDKPTLSGKLTSKNIATIPRASTFTLSPTSINTGETITVNITRASSDFRHNVKFYKDEIYSADELKNVETSASCVIPHSWFPDSLGGKVYCKVTTLDGVGGSQIGDAATMSFDVTVPSDIKPVVGEITVTIDSINDNNILVKGKNQFTITVSGSAAGEGSTIKSQSITGQNMSVDSNSGDDLSGVGGPIDATFDGDYREFEYTVKVTDNRGAVSSETITVVCYNYSSPYFASFKAYRADADGTANANGTYLKCTHRVSYSSVNDTNAVSITYKVVDANSEVNIEEKIMDQSADGVIIDLGDKDKTYQVYAVVTDLYGGSKSSATIPVFGQARILNISKDGQGFAIGKMSEKPTDATNGLFECKWDAKFYGTVEYEGTIDCTGIKVNQKTIFDLIYPVGSIYMSVNSVDPSAIFGGAWTQIEDRFLLAAGSTYEAGTTGGSTEHTHSTQDHTLTTKQIPPHSHTTTVELKMASSNNTGSFSTQQIAVGKEGDTIYTNSNPVTVSSGDTGGGEAHNHGNTSSASSMPPYLAVYVWKRTV